VFRTRNDKISSAFEDGYLFSVDKNGTLKSIINRKGHGYSVEKYLNLSFGANFSWSPENVIKVKGIRGDYKTGYFTISIKGVSTDVQ
jgi:hypothetical protein